MLEIKHLLAELMAGIINVHGLMINVPRPKSVAKGSKVKTDKKKKEKKDKKRKVVSNEKCMTCRKSLTLLTSGLADGECVSLSWSHRFQDDCLSLGKKRWRM